jgi:hypothetical protein
VLGNERLAVDRFAAIDTFEILAQRGRDARIIRLGG